MRAHFEFSWLAQSLIPFSQNRLVREAIENVRKYFDSTETSRRQSLKAQPRWRFYVCICLTM